MDGGRKTGELKGSCEKAIQQLIKEGGGKIMGGVKRLWKRRGNEVYSGNDG